MLPKSVSGRATIIFENRKDLVYPYSHYRKRGNSVKFYNVVITNKQCHEVANKLPLSNHVNKTLPNYKIVDEKKKTLFDSKFDRLDDFLD